MQAKYFFLFMLFYCNIHLRGDQQDVVTKKVLVVAGDGVVFKNKMWKKQRDALVFALRHYSELPLMIFTSIGLAYKMVRRQKLTVASVLKSFPVLEQYKHEIYDFITFENPNQEVIALLRKLKEQGFLLVFVAPIIQESYDYNTQLRPEIFSLFDFCFNDLTKKTDQHYFLRLREKIAGYLKQEDVEITYLDNQKVAVAAANQSEAKVHGVIFTSAEELEEELVECNLPQCHYEERSSLRLSTPTGLASYGGSAESACPPKF